MDIIMPGLQTTDYSSETLDQYIAAALSAYMYFA